MSDRRVDVTPLLAIVTGALGCVVLTSLVLRLSATPRVSAPAVHPAPEAETSPEIVRPWVIIQGSVRPEVFHFAPLPEVPAIEHLVLPRRWAPPTPDERTLVDGGALILHEGLPRMDEGRATFTLRAGPPHRRHPDRRKRRRRPGG